MPCLDGCGFLSPRKLGLLFLSAMILVEDDAIDRKLKIAAGLEEIIASVITIRTSCLRPMSEKALVVYCVLSSECGQDKV